MARYIDADELLNKLSDGLPYKASVKRVLIQAPEADVVPKSEVEKIFDEIESLLYLNQLQGDIFVGKYFDADLENDIAELKKKYTEEKSDG